MIAALIALMIRVEYHFLALPYAAHQTVTVHLRWTRANEAKLEMYLQVLAYYKPDEAP